MLEVVYGKDEKENINKQRLWQVKSSNSSLFLTLTPLLPALLSSPLPGNCKPCCSSSPPRRPAAQRSPRYLLPCPNRRYCGAPTTNPN